MTKVKTILFTIWGLNLGNGWDEHYQKNRSMILKYHHEKGYPQVSQLSTDLTSGPDSGSLRKHVFLTVNQSAEALPAQACLLAELVKPKLLFENLPQGSSYHII